TQLWKGTGSPASRRPSKSFLIFLLIGYIKRAAIQTYQTPFSVPSTFRGFHGNRPYNLIVQLPNGRPPQPTSSLRDTGLTGHLDDNPGPHKPLYPFKKTAQDFTIRRLHVQGEGNDVVHYHMRRKIPLPPTRLPGVSEHRINGAYRKGFRDYSQTNVIRNACATWKLCNGAR